MIPKSRLSHRGAYRDVVPNEVDGVTKNELFGTAVGNKLFTRLSYLNIGPIGDFNNIMFYKRSIVQAKPPKTYIADITINVGKENSGVIKLMNPDPVDIEMSVTLGDFNNLDIRTYDNDNIVMGNRNTAIGELDTRNNGVIIGDNNYLVDFKSEITKGRFVKGYPKIGSLMFSTKVAEYAGVGQTYIEIEDTSRVSNGMEIIFGSVGAGFVRRDITAVSGQKVYFSMPLDSKEATFPNALAFNEYYDIYPAYSSTISADAVRRSKRIFVTDNQNLHLRKVTIGGTFETIVFFMREADNMTIIKDMTPEDITAGTTISSEEINPYSAWIPGLVQDADTPEKYNIAGVNKAFIGRTVTIDAIEYAIIGFTEDTVTFSQALPVDTDSVYFGELDSSPSGSMVTSHISLDIAGNTLSLPVEDGNKFFVGQSIKVEGMSTLGVIKDISGNSLILEEKLLEDVITNKFYVGLYELHRNKNAARAVINDAKADLHTYIFGEN